MTTTLRPTVELLAQVGRLHEVDAVLDALEVGPRDVQVDRVHGARRDRDRVVVPLQVLERDVDADGRVEHEPDAQALDEADVHLDRLARQAERRDADQHRAAAEGQAVEDRDLVAAGRELAGDREAGRTRADHRDPLLARRDGRHDVRDARRLVPLDEEPLHRADRQRAVDVAAAAGALAGRRADIRAHRRDRVRLAGEDVALLEPPLGGEVEVAPAVGADGTGLLALDVALEPGRVHGLDEELLGLIEGHEADVPLVCGGSSWATGNRGGGRRRPAEITKPGAAVHSRGAIRPIPDGPSTRRKRSSGGRSCARGRANRLPHARPSGTRS